MYSTLNVISLFRPYNTRPRDGQPDLHHFKTVVLLPPVNDKEVPLGMARIKRNKNDVEIVGIPKYTLNKIEDEDFYSILEMTGDVVLR